MKKEAVERILKLQECAYELLLWLDARADRDQEILSDRNLEKWRYAESCEAWVRDVHGMIPVSIRPGADDIPDFARLFTSFFQTSFHVVESAPIRVYNDWGDEDGWTGSGKRRLKPGAPGGKKSAKGKERVRESAQELRLIALEELALEHEMLPGREDLLCLDDAPALRPDLILWTYIHELDRRARFSSQGEAVRSLWVAMDKKEREKITASKVLKARDNLVAALQARLKSPA